jgi:DNA-binding IclR family transcriptional regulator
MTKRSTRSPSKDPKWTFLTNHFHVLRCLSGEATTPLREVADRVGITERAVQKIVFDLEAAGYITRSKVGRQNSYGINVSGKLRHDLDQGHLIGSLLELLGEAVPNMTKSRPSTGPTVSTLRISIR